MVTNLDKCFIISLAVEWSDISFNVSSIYFTKMEKEPLTSFT